MQTELNIFCEKAKLKPWERTQGFPNWLLSLDFFKCSHRGQEICRTETALGCCDDEGKVPLQVQLHAGIDPRLLFCRSMDILQQFFQRYDNASYLGFF